jgi:hypothetical protein
VRGECLGVGSPNCDGDRTGEGEGLRLGLGSRRVKPWFGLRGDCRVFFFRLYSPRQ